MSDREAIRKALAGIFDVSCALGQSGQTQAADKIGDQMDVLLEGFGFSIEEVAFAK